MKLLLLRVLLQRRAKDEGFTLPMVIALGLVMILLGVVNITSANEENITAISQNSRADAIAIAELGIARYRELLDRNRVLAIYDSAQWGTVTEICNGDIATYLPGATAKTIQDTQDLDNDGNTTENIGSYSLVSYDYVNNDATPIANGTFDLTDDTVNNNTRGILTVRGTAPNNAGEAQIQVEIPIRLNPGDMTNLAPALWIGDNTVTAAKLGNNLTISNGNIVIRDNKVGTTSGCRNFSDADTTDGSQDLASSITFSPPPVTVPPTPQGTVISDSRNLPPLTAINTDINNARTALSKASGDPVNALPGITVIVDPITENNNNTRIFGTTSNTPYKPDYEPPTGGTLADFDPIDDCSDIRDCRYYYAPAAAGGKSYTNEDLLTDGIAKTTLLLDENLAISAAARNIEVGSTSTVVNDSDSFEIYVQGSRTITLNADAGQTLTINGFIHAPDSTLSITGGGNVTINGSVWVKDFINTNTGAVNISPDDLKVDSTNEDKSYKFYSTTDGRTPRPLTGSPTNWKTEQIN